MSDTGVSKNLIGLPPEITSARRRFLSRMSPSTMPRTIGAMG